MSLTAISPHWFSLTCVNEQWSLHELHTTAGTVCQSIQRELRNLWKVGTAKIITVCCVIAKSNSDWRCMAMSTVLVYLIVQANRKVWSGGECSTQDTHYRTQSYGEVGGREGERKENRGKRDSSHNPFSTFSWSLSLSDFVSCWYSLINIFKLFSAASCCVSLVPGNMRLLCCVCVTQHHVVLASFLGMRLICCVCTTSSRYELGHHSYIIVTMVMPAEGNIIAKIILKKYS